MNDCRLMQLSLCLSVYMFVRLSIWLSREASEASPDCKRKRGKTEKSKIGLNVSQEK